MVEAILLPYFDIRELVTFAGLSKSARSMFTLFDSRCVNFKNLLNQKLDLDDAAQNLLSKCEVFMDILKFIASYSQ
jgi:hypothetical protein